MSGAEPDGRRTTFDEMESRNARGMSQSLTPMTPAEAVTEYLQYRKPDLSEKSLYNQKSRLNHFVEWCEDNDIDNLNDLTGRTLHRYRVHRSEQVKAVTLDGELQTFRVFLEFAASIEAVRPGTRELVQMPNVSPEEETKDELLESERAIGLIDTLERFAYASRAHLIHSLIWHTGLRLGALRGIDLGDIDLGERSIWIRHRPEADTPLKNGKSAERMISLAPRYADMLEAYVENNRHDVTDEYGRRPLITTSYGRISEGTVREEVYRHTQPCEWGDCPHDRDPNTCDYRHYHNRSRCPSSRSPHGVRRGAMTYARKRGVPLDVVCERMNASPEIVEKHYDKRTERERMENRRRHFEEE